MTSTDGNSSTAGPGTGIGLHVRRLLLQANDAEIELETIIASSDEAQLSGRVRAEMAPIGGVMRLSTTSMERTARLSESDEFNLHGVARGAYRLEFRFDNRLIEIPVLPI